MIGGTRTTLDELHKWAVVLKTMRQPQETVAQAKAA